MSSYETAAKKRAVGRKLQSRVCLAGECQITLTARGDVDRSFGIFRPARRRADIGEQQWTGLSSGASFIGNSCLRKSETWGYRHVETFPRSCTFLFCPILDSSLHERLGGRHRHQRLDQDGRNPNARVRYLGVERNSTDRRSECTSYRTKWSWAALI